MSERNMGGPDQKRKLAPHLDPVVRSVVVGLVTGQ